VKHQTRLLSKLDSRQQKRGCRQQKRGCRQPTYTGKHITEVSVSYTCSKNDVISSVRKHYCALGLGLGLAELCFRSNIF